MAAILTEMAELKEVVRRIDQKIDRIIKPEPASQDRTGSEATAVVEERLSETPTDHN